MMQILIKAKRVVVTPVDNTFVAFIYRPDLDTRARLMTVSDKQTDSLIIDINDETGEWFAGTKWLVLHYERTDDHRCVTLHLQREDAQ